MAGCRYQHYVLIVSAQLRPRNKFPFIAYGIHFYFILDFHAKRRKFMRHRIYQTMVLDDVCSLPTACQSVRKYFVDVRQRVQLLPLNGCEPPEAKFFFHSRVLGSEKTSSGGRNSWQFCVLVIVSSHVPPTFHLLIIDTVRSVSVPRMLNHFRALFVHNLDASHSEESNFPRLPRKRSFPS